MRPVAWAYGFAQSTTAENVVPCERDQHGVFQVVVERVGVGDALDRDTGGSIERFSDLSMGRAKRAAKVGREKRPESVSGKIGDRNHKRLLARRAPPWRARTSRRLIRSPRWRARSEAGIVVPSARAVSHVDGKFELGCSTDRLAGCQHVSSPHPSLLVKVTLAHYAKRRRRANCNSWPIASALPSRFRAAGLGDGL